jgi:hypothetical protein
MDSATEAKAHDRGAPDGRMGAPMARNPLATRSRALRHPQRCGTTVRCGSVSQTPSHLSRPDRICYQ